MNKKLKDMLQNIEEYLNFVLPEKIGKSWQDIAFDDLPDFFSDKHILNLTVPCRELMTRGGKRWRPLLTVLSCKLMGADEKYAYPLTPLIELCHTASLIHDDMEDNSDERRGGVAIHLKYGRDTAINAGSWLYFHAMTVISTYSDKKKLSKTLYELYTKNLRRLHLGQAMDINWHRNSEYIPTQEEYLAMTNLKTGTLSRLAGELGVLAAGKSEKKAVRYGELMAQMGLSFQILDDVKNISGGIKGKNLGDDIVEGKKSLPVILYLEKNPKSKEKILNLFKKANAERISSSAVGECVDIISNSNALDEAKAIADKILETTIKTIKTKYHKNEAMDLIFELFNMIL